MNRGTFHNRSMLAFSGLDFQTNFAYSPQFLQPPLAGVCADCIDLAPRKGDWSIFRPSDAFLDSASAENMDLSPLVAPKGTVPQ